MKPLRPALLFLLITLPGCANLGAYFGYYKHQKADWAPPEESERIKFPNSFEGSTRLSGPMMKALETARNEFIPPGTNPASEKDLVAQCLSRWETFTTSILQVDDNLFFIRFSPDGLPKCAPERIVLDGGAVYAIDGQGRVLAVHH